jgi:hypothetical protein
MGDLMKLDTFKSKWGQRPAPAPPRPPALQPEPEPVVSSSAEQSPVEAGAVEYDGIPLSLVLERHLERLRAKA